MKISSTALPLLMPSWIGTSAFQHQFQHSRHASSSRTCPAPTHLLVTSARSFSSLQMSSLLNQESLSNEIAGDVLSSNGKFAVIRVSDDSLGQAADLPAASAAAGEKEEGSVELAQALFSAQPDMVQNPNGGMIADGDLIGRTITFPNNSQGLVVAYRHPIAFVLIESTSDTTQNHDAISCSISTDLVSINPDIPPGSTVNYMGKPVQVDQDGNVSSGTSPQTNSDASRPIFVPIPKISDIGLINTPLVTGITAIDALTPIGKGQNMLVIGTQEKGTGDDDGTVNKSNKKAWMMNMLKSVVENDKDLRAKSGGGSNVRCFYGLTSSDSKARSTLMERLVTAGIKDDVVTLVATQSNGVAEDKMTRALEACEAVAVAATACTLGEHHAHTTGGDALVIVDDINLHKSLWDITTKQLVEIYGVDSVVKADLQGGSSSEMRGFFSGLIQRAARFKASKGGGSVTLILLSTLPSDEELNGGADNSEEEMVFDPSEFESMSEKIRTRIATLVNAKVPLTAANLRKIQIPVPRPSESEDAKRLALQHVEDLISMSDGQIWFDDELARSGRSPPLDPSRSITRVGIGADTPCRADAPALRTVSGSLRFQFQQASDMITRKDNSAINAPGDTKQLLRQEAFLLAMHQSSDESRKLSQECVSLIAASRGYFDKILKEGHKAGTPKGQDVVNGLLKHVELQVGDTIAAIDDSLEMSLEDMALIENAIEGYFA